jgi:hypothetical protein
MHLSIEKHLCQKQEYQVHCCSVRTELVFERNTSENYSFQSEEGLTLFQIGLLS